MHRYAGLVRDARTRKQERSRATRWLVASISLAAVAAASSGILVTQKFVLPNNAMLSADASAAQPQKHCAERGFEKNFIAASVIRRSGNLLVGGIMPGSGLEVSYVVKPGNEPKRVLPVPAHTSPAFVAALEKLDADIRKACEETLNSRSARASRALANE